MRFTTTPYNAVSNSTVSREHMVGISQKFFKIEVGSLVKRANRTFTVTHLMAANRVLGKDVESNQAETLHVDEIELVREDSPKTEVDPAKPTRDALQCTPEEWAEGQRRFAAIKPLLDNPLRNRKEVEAIAKTHHVHIATLYRWLKTYTREGHVGALVPDARGPKRGSRRLDKHQELIISSAIDDLFLTPQRHTKARVIEEVLRRCNRAGVASPNANTVYNRIAVIDPARRLRRQGKRDQARDLYEPIRGHFEGATHPLSVVQIDHTLADIILVDEINHLPISRPWITLAIDVYSRMVVGMHIGFDAPSSLTAGLCLANAICTKREYLTNLGVPGEWPCWGLMNVVHSDNGKEFHGSTLQLACETYGIDLQKRAIGKPMWGAHIERLMNIVARELHTYPGTTFSNPKMREGYDSEKEAALTLRVLERCLCDFIVNVYHQRIHGQLGVPPWKQWEKGIVGDGRIKGSGYPYLPEDPKRVSIDFLPYEMRTVQQYGIQIEKVEYYDPVLDPYILAQDPDQPKQKREFIVRRDPRDISKVYFLDPADNRYVTIPYSNIGLPAVSSQELAEARRRLRQEGEAAQDQERIFSAIERIRAEADAAKIAKKSARRQIARRPSVASTARPAETHAPAPQSRMSMSVEGEEGFVEDVKPFDQISLIR